MSVLVKKLKSQTIEAYVKGAPEVMLDICDKSTCRSEDLPTSKFSPKVLLPQQYLSITMKCWRTTLSGVIV